MERQDIKSVVELELLYAPKVQQFVAIVRTSSHEEQVSIHELKEKYPNVCKMVRDLLAD